MVGRQPSEALLCKTSLARESIERRCTPSSLISQREERIVELSYCHVVLQVHFRRDKQVKFAEGEKLALHSIDRL